jgi:hypothetical protein
MMTNLRRFVLMVAVMFWQGGFTFYSAVVIHVGKQVLGSHLEQGFVTRSVTNYLNVAGAVALLLWGWDLAVTMESGIRRKLRWGLWIALVLALGALAWLHVDLDELLNPSALEILDRPRFLGLHRLYLYVSEVQWGGSLILGALTLVAWRAEDTKQAAVNGGSSAVT